MTIPTTEVSQAPLPFRYEAQTPAGQAIRGTLDAASPAAAQAQLAALNLRVLSVEPAGPAEKRRPPLGPDDFMLFNQQLAHMTAAGLPIDRGLRLIAADLKSGRLSAAANAVAADLEGGASLHDAFARHASRFPALYARLIEAGVQANNLPALLFNFGRHLELQARLRRTLWRTLSYPIAVLAALAAVLLFISLYILPQMQDIYVQFQKDWGESYEFGGGTFELPFLTRCLLWFGPRSPYIFGGIAGVAILAALAVFILRRAGREGALLDLLVLPLPLVGPVVSRSMIARWCDALRVAIDAGLDLPQGISLAAEAVGSPRLARESNVLLDTIARGDAPANAPTTLLPPSVTSAIGFAVRAADLPATLASLTAMYVQQAEQRLRALPAILTPALMIFVGGFFALTILALFMPLFKLMGHFLRM